MLQHWQNSDSHQLIHFPSRRLSSSVIRCLVYGWRLLQLIYSTFYHKLTHIERETVKKRRASSVDVKRYYDICIHCYTE